MGNRQINRNVTYDGGQWSNAEEDTIGIEPYNPAWPEVYREERERLLSVLPEDMDVTLEHFGSTAIPGAAAKPVIDILVICPELKQWERFIQPLESLGYVYWASNPWKDRMFFVKGMPPFGKRRTHHVHIMKPETANDRLLFRDYMKEHPEKIQQYEKLKKKLMKKYKTNRDAYTRGKKDFIDQILMRMDDH